MAVCCVRLRDQEAEEGGGGCLKNNKSRATCNYQPAASKYVCALGWQKRGKKAHISNA